MFKNVSTMLRYVINDFRNDPYAFLNIKKQAKHFTSQPALEAIDDS